MDCRPSGVGEVIKGPTGAGTAELLTDGCASGRSLELSIAGGTCGGRPLSSSVIANLKVPSTIATTLAAISTERTFEATVEGSLAALLLASPAEGFAPYHAAGPVVRSVDDLGRAMRDIQNPETYATYARGVRILRRLLSPERNAERYLAGV